MQKREKYIIVVDFEDDGRCILNCLKAEIKNRVERLYVVNGVERGKHIDGVPLANLSEMGSIEGKGVILYSQFCDDITGDSVFNLYQYDLFWSRLSPEHYMIIHDFEELTNKSDIETVVIGMSYVQRGINIDRIQGYTALLASPTQDIYNDYMIYRWAEKKGMQSKRVIIDMTTYRLWYDLSLSNNRVRSFYYFPQTESMHHFNPGFDTTAFFLGMKRDKEELFEKDVIWEINANHFVNQGYDIEKKLYGQIKDLAVFGSMSEEEKQGFSDEVKRLYHKPYPDTFRENTEIIREWVDHMMDTGTKAIFVLPPFPAVYRENMDVKMHQTTKDFLDGLEKQYSNVRYLDYTEHEAFDDAYFSDWNHLNYFGANLWARILSDDILKTVET